RLTRADALLTDRGVVSALLARLVPIVPFTLISYAGGLSGMRLRDHLLGSAIGLTPGTVLHVAVGGDRRRRRTRRRPDAAGDPGAADPGPRRVRGSALVAAAGRGGRPPRAGAACSAAVYRSLALAAESRRPPSSPRPPRRRPAHSNTRSRTLLVSPASESERSALVWPCLAARLEMGR
ncbi:hypothetical protein A7K94_0212855, partial [Modestobacter sp. VKM Ac-2676]